MKFKNLSRVERNMLTGLFCQFVTILLGFLMPRLYLTYYGSGVNGELNTIKQLFAYLYLLEAGVGLATTQALYRPVAMEEHQTVSEILAATDHYYRRTGTLYALIVVAIGIVYPMVVHFTLPRGVVLLYTILYGLPSVTSFFVQGKYRLLMDVDGRRYVLSNLETATNLISGIGKVLVLMLTQNLLAMQLLYCLCSMLPIPVILWYTHKNYPWIDHHAKPDYSAVAQKNSVLMHQLSGVIFNNTDMVLLSYFCNFQLVSVYSIYNMFFVQIIFVMNLFLNSISFRMGQIFHTDRERFLGLFDLCETLYLAFVAFCYTMTAAFLLPVIPHLHQRHPGHQLHRRLPAAALRPQGRAGERQGHLPPCRPVRRRVPADPLACAGRDDHQSDRHPPRHPVLRHLRLPVRHSGRTALPHGAHLPLHLPEHPAPEHGPPALKWVCDLGLMALILRIVGIQSRPELSLPGVIGVALLHMIWIGAAFAGAAFLFDHDLLRKLRALRSSIRS